MIEEIQLGLIESNPWQPRVSIDAEHIAQLARSIEKDGLLQTPRGRRVGEKIQLAFGHNRLLAFKQLKYPRMPVDVLEIDDQEMARIALSENIARKDLSPLEIARAMKRYQDEFHASSIGLGELFGLSDSAVRNKLRLLELPEACLAALDAGVMSEGAGREVLSLLALPGSLRDAAERQWQKDKTPGGIIQAAVQGANAEYIRSRVGEMIREYANELAGAGFKYSDQVLDPQGNPLPVCTGCPNKIQKDKKDLCLDRVCLNQKISAYRRAYERMASFESGIPVIERDESGGEKDHATFYSFGDALKALKIARESKCPNLRVKFNPGHRDETSLENFPSTSIVCAKRQGFCTCYQAIKAGVDLAAKVETPADAGGEKDKFVAPPITHERLKEVAKEARSAKRGNFAACRELLDRAAWIIGEAFYEANQGAVRMLLNHMSWTFRDKTDLTREDVRFEIGRLLAAGIYNADGYTEPNPALALEKYNAALRAAGLVEIEAGVSVETVEEEA